MAIAALRSAVEATKNSSSFTVWTNEQYRVVYKGPDRCEIVEGQGYRIIDIGDYEYTQPPGSHTWQKPTLQLPSETQCVLGTIFLTPLLYSNQVQRSGDTYQVRGTPTIVNSVQISGWWRVTLVVHADKVVQEVVISTPTSTHPGVVVDLGSAVITYSAFGTSPPVTAPPTNDISG